jgi:hypothetical protein
MIMASTHQPMTLVLNQDDYDWLDYRYDLIDRVSHLYDIPLLCLQTYSVEELEDLKNEAV